MYDDGSHPETIDAGATGDATLPERMSITVQPRFSRSIFGGFKREQVDQWTRAQVLREDELRIRLDASHSQVHTLREKLAASEREVRFWRDREHYIDSQMEDARKMSDEIVASAQRTAVETMEKTQESAISVIESSISEARSILDQARRDAEDAVRQANYTVRDADDKMQQVVTMRNEVLRAMRQTITHLEHETDIRGKIPTRRPISVQSDHNDGAMTLRGVPNPRDNAQPVAGVVAPLHA